ncbi:hypothetical protein [Rubrobacter marinus]|uniref:hypothetical protein n=1 Tax=Rubrobacter marinus TaxID=2653852 RepID=UPI001A9D29FC|nr:hypothetical protein [Rubrobacter marinus]
MFPGQTSGTSMFPPKGPGASALMASRSGATARVPMKGCQSSSTPRSSLVSLSPSSFHTHVFSGNGSCSVRVMAVEVRPPK